MSDIASLTNKIISDPDFCAALVSDPASTLASHGISANDEIIAALQGQNAESLQRLAAAFGNQNAAAAAAA